MSAIPDYNFAVAADIQTGIQILLYPSLLLGLFPDFFGYTPSSRSQVFGIYAGFAITIILIIVKEGAGRETYLTPPVWAFMVMAAVVIATETFDYVDDNTRQNDKPHAISLKHILEKLENAQSRGSVVQVGSEIVNPLASSTIGQIQPKVTDTIDVVRICRNDGKLRCLSDFKTRQSTWQQKSLRGEPLADATASGNQPISNRMLVGISYILLYLGLPWWQPGQEARYTGGFPDWAIVMLTFSAVSTVIVAYTLWSWQNPSKEALERLKNPKM